MKSLQAKTCSIGILIGFIFLLTNCLTYGNIKDRITKTFSVGSGGTLLLESDIGSISVQGADIDSVEIEILREVKTNNEKKADKILKDYDIQFNHSGNDVSIDAKYKKKGIKGFWNNIGKHLRVKYIVTVPSEYNVELHTKGGSITVEDIRGEILSKTSGGSLSFENIKGNISGNTSGGSIRIRQAEGPVEAHTSGGSITVEEVIGTIEAHTSGGSVKAYLSRQPDSDCRLTTSGGSITVQLSKDMSLDVNAKTAGGRVHADFPVSISGKIDKNSMQAQMNGGGPELYLRTSGGSIYLKKL